MTVKAKLNLSKLNAEETRDKANAVVAAMTGAAANFPTPSPALTVITTATATLNTLILAGEALKSELQENTQLVNNAMEIVKTHLRAEIGYVEGVANAPGNTPAVAKAIVESAAMDVAGGGSPVGPMPKVTGLSGTQGDEPGEVDLQWNPTKDGLKAYIGQTTTDPAATTGWTYIPLAEPGKSKASITGLPSATKQWFRIAAQGAAGQGPWSDPVQVTIP
jgi:hypothetical protein